MGELVTPPYVAAGAGILGIVLLVAGIVYAIRAARSAGEASFAAAALLSLHNEELARRGAKVTSRSERAILRSDELAQKTAALSTSLSELRYLLRVVGIEREQLNRQLLDLALPTDRSPRPARRLSDDPGREPGQQWQADGNEYRDFFAGEPTDDERTPRRPQAPAQPEQGRRRRPFGRRV